MEQCKWNPPTGGKKGMHITASGKVVKRSELGSVADGTPMLKLNCEEPTRRQRAAVEKRMAELREKGTLEDILNGRAPLPKDLRDAGWVLMHRNEASDKHDDRIAALAGMATTFKGTEFEQDLMAFAQTMTASNLSFHWIGRHRDPLETSLLAEQFSCAALELLSSTSDQIPEAFRTELWAAIASHRWASASNSYATSEGVARLADAAALAGRLMAQGLDPRLAVSTALINTKTSSKEGAANVLASLAAQGVFSNDDQAVSYAAMLDAIAITKNFESNKISERSVKLAMDLCGPIKATSSGLGPNVLLEAAAAEATGAIRLSKVGEILTPVVHAVEGTPEERAAAAAALLTGFVKNPRGLVIEPGAIDAIASQIHGTTLADGTYITDKSAVSVQVAASLASNAAGLMRPYIALAGTPSEDELFKRIDSLDLVTAERDRAKAAVVAGDLKAALLAAPGLDWACIDGRSVRSHLDSLGDEATAVIGSTSHHRRLEVLSNYPDVITDRAAQQLAQIIGSADFDALQKTMEVAYAVKDDPDAAYEFARSIIVTADKLAEMTPKNRAHLLHAGGTDEALQLVGEVAVLDSTTASAPFTRALAGILREGSTASVASIEGITDAMRQVDNGYFSLEDPYEDGSLAAVVALSGFSRFGRITSHESPSARDSDVSSILAAASATLREERSFRATHGFSHSEGPVDASESFAVAEQKPYLASVSAVVASYRPLTEALDVSDIYMPPHDRYKRFSTDVNSDEQIAIRAIVERVESVVGHARASDPHTTLGEEAAAGLAAVVLRDLKRSGGTSKDVHYEAAVALAEPKLSGVSLAEAAMVSEGARDAYAAVVHAALDAVRADIPESAIYVGEAAKRLGVGEPSPRLKVISGTGRVALEYKDAPWEKGTAGTARLYLEAGLEDDVAAILRRDLPELKVTRIDGGLAVKHPRGEHFEYQLREVMDHVERTFSV
jgi:hypothetical protein